MITEEVLIKVDDGAALAEVLELAARDLEATGGELRVDFSGVRRFDAAGLRALENLVRMAEEKGVKVSLRGVNVSVYKVLKLIKIAQRVTFLD